MRLGIEAGSHTIEVATEHGIRGVPISVEQLVNDGVSAVLAPLQKVNLQVCQIGAFAFNPLSSDRISQESQKRMLEKAIPLASETGCPYIVINGGNYHPSGFLAGDERNFGSEAINQIAAELAPLIELAEKNGVKLSIEPYLKGAINTPERFLALTEKISSDALCCNIDVTSLYAYHEMWNPAPAVDHICTSLAGHYGLAHIKDIALKDGFHIHIDLAPLGSSLTDWSQVLRLVAPNLPKDSWMILEHVLSPEEARSSLELLRQAADDAGVSLA